MADFSRFLSHVDTIVPAKLARKPHAPLYRETWCTPDDDLIAVDHTSQKTGQPRVMLFHGLEGSSQSHYARYLAAACEARGLAATFPHFRTCGEQINRQPRAYHAGDWQEVGWMIDNCIARYQPSDLYLIGVSLGGNALLNWLGRTPANLHTCIRAAVAVSAPMNLMRAGNALNIGWNKRLYGDYFLSTLKPKALALLQQFPLLADRLNGPAIAKATTIREFDEYFTAPVHGYHSVEDYWQQASSLPYLKSIQLPTLLLNALNDPFIPADSLPASADLSATIRCQFTDRGGHVGWHRGWPWQKYNNELMDRIFRYLESPLSSV